MGKYLIYTITGLSDVATKELVDLNTSIKTLSSSIRYYDHRTGEAMQGEIEKKRKRALGLAAKIQNKDSRTYWERSILGYDN